MALILALVVLPLATSNYFIIWITILAMIYSVLSISWLFMEKQAGWTSFAHSIPFGLAAYAFAVNPALVLPSVLAALAAFLVLSTFGRAKFTLSTFIITVAAWTLSYYIVFEQNGVLVGGEEGFSVKSLDLTTSYILSALLLLSSYIVVKTLTASPIGLKIAAARDDEEAARAVGVDVVRMRIIAYFASIVLASLAGICYALFFGHVSSDVFSIEVSLFPFVATFIAGNRCKSTVLGSYTIDIISRVLSGVIPEFHLVIYSAVLITSPLLRRWWDDRG